MDKQPESGRWPGAAFTNRTRIALVVLGLAAVLLGIFLYVGGFGGQPDTVDRSRVAGEKVRSGGSSNQGRSVENDNSSPADDDLSGGGQDTPDTTGQAEQEPAGPPGATPPGNPNPADEGSRDQTAPSSGPATKAEHSAALARVTLIIDHGKRQTFEVEVGAEATIYDVLTAASDEHGFSLGVKNHSSFGVFVDEIDGVRTDERAGLYWLYYLNGDYANLGASLQRVSSGDTILWKYQKER